MAVNNEQWILFRALLDVHIFILLRHRGSLSTQIEKPQYNAKDMKAIFMLWRNLKCTDDTTSNEKLFLSRMHLVPLVGAYLAEDIISTIMKLINEIKPNYKLITTDEDDFLVVVKEEENKVIEVNRRLTI